MPVIADTEMTRMFSFVFIVVISIIAVVIAVLGVIVVSQRASKSKGKGIADIDKADNEGWIVCRYCGTRNRSSKSNCKNCGASL